MSTLGSVSFWIDVGERAVRSFAQGVLTASGVGVAGELTPASLSGALGVKMPSIPWQADLLFGVALAVVAVLTSLASLKIPNSDHDTGSFLPPAPEQLPKLQAFITQKRRR